MDILTEIISAKKERLREAVAQMPLDRLRDLAAEARRRATPHALLHAIAQESGLNIIAEFKRRSPSKGIIRPNADPALIASSYERAGAAAISVLTEQDYFAGSLVDLAAVRRATTLPILRKDFIFDEYQVYEAAAARADAVLLIVAALSDDRLATLRAIAEDELGLDALVEIHNRDELRRACAAGATLIGVNNRDLRTFSVSLDTSLQLAAEAPGEVLLISESGLNSQADLLRLQAAGFKGFLIGESLMRAAEPEETLRVLLKAVG